MTLPFHHLDGVPWAELEHAYGYATDVPDDLRALASDDAQARSAAQWNLAGNIFHQGSVYSATLAAMPFLLGCLAAEEMPDRWWLLRYLAKLSIGDPQRFFATGYDLSKEPDGSWEHEDARRAKDVYDAIHAALPTVISLLQDADPALRRDAAFLLAFHLGARDSIESALRARLQEEADAQARAAMLMTLGMSGYQVGHTDDLELLRAAARDERLGGLGAVACAYLNLTGDVQREIFGLLRPWAETGGQRLEGFPWRDGHRQTMCFAALCWHAGADREAHRETLYALMLRAEPDHRKPSEANALARDALVAEWNAQFEAYTHPDGAGVDSLNDAQRRLLQLVVRSHDLATPELLRAAQATGFPETLPELRAFVGVAPAEPLNRSLEVDGQTMTAQEAFLRLTGTGAEGVSVMEPVGSVQISFEPRKKPQDVDPFDGRMLDGPLRDLAVALAEWTTDEAMLAIHAALVDDPQLFPEAIALMRDVVERDAAGVARAIASIALPYVEHGARLTPDRRGMQVRYDILAWVLEAARLTGDPPDATFDPLATVVLRRHASFANAFFDALPHERASALCAALIRNLFRTPLDRPTPAGPSVRRSLGDSLPRTEPR